MFQHKTGYASRARHDDFRMCRECGVMSQECGVNMSQRRCPLLFGNLQSTSIDTSHITHFLRRGHITHNLITIMSQRKTVGILGKIRTTFPACMRPVAEMIGGGQLGRMLTHPAALLGIPLFILDSGTHTPAKQTLLAPSGSDHPDGPFTSEPHIRELAKQCDVLTVEIEHVNADVLEAVEKEGLCEVQPSPATIRLIQDKYLQKKFLAERGIPVAPFEGVDQKTEEGIKAITTKLGLPIMLKARTLAYDGRGNSPLQSTTSEDINASFEFLGDRPLYAEGWCPFVKEVAVMVVRNKEGEVRSYDAVETIHKDSILRVCMAPLRAKGMEGVNERARQLAEKAVGHLQGAGIFGVEMFLMEDGQSHNAQRLLRHDQ